MLPCWTLNVFTRAYRKYQTYLNIFSKMASKRKIYAGGIQFFLNIYTYSRTVGGDDALTATTWRAGDSGKETFLRRLPHKLHKRFAANKPSESDSLSNSHCSDGSRSSAMESFRSFETIPKGKNQIRSILGGQRRGELILQNSHSDVEI